jgi:hypothetical protein
MAVRRVLIIANETVADVAAIPEVVRKIAEAEESASRTGRSDS